jgi:hypothetical protein
MDYTPFYEELGKYEESRRWKIAKDVLHLILILVILILQGLIHYQIRQSERVRRHVVYRGTTPPPTYGTTTDRW